MSVFALILLAFAMSMDAFAAAIAQGTKQVNINLNTALKIGAVFGVTEMIAPTIGYFIGSFAQAWVENIDHWVSFVLLVGLGLHLLYETFFAKDDNNQGQSDGFGKAILTAIATSIDAMIMGVSLAFLTVNIWLAACLIGGATFFMTSIGAALGAKLGEKIGKLAQIFGAVVLIGIGSFILFSHLSNA